MTIKNYSFRFNPNKRGLRKILGDLETSIMEIVWNQGDVKVRQVFDILREDQQLAYTTVMTVMSRLSDKGLLKKIKEGSAFVYSATLSKNEFTQSTVKKVVGELLRDFTTPAINQFVEIMGDKQPEIIDELSHLIEEKRKKKNV